MQQSILPYRHLLGWVFFSTEEGKIYSLVVNETQLDQPRSYTVQLALRKVSKCLPHISIRNMHSNQSSAVYLTGNSTTVAGTPVSAQSPRQGALWLWQGLTILASHCLI